MTRYSLDFGSRTSCTECCHMRETLVWKGEQCEEVVRITHSNLSAHRVISDYRNACESNGREEQEATAAAIPNLRQCSSLGEKYFMASKHVACKSHPNVHALIKSLSHRFRPSTIHKSHWHPLSTRESFCASTESLFPQTLRPWPELPH